MPTTSGKAAIYYELLGDPNGSPLVLLEGGGNQLIGWREEFCALLVDRGFLVIRLDWRDTGLSQRFGGENDLDGGYEVTDLADDVVRVLDHAGVRSAHVAGQSMGGIVAQELAIRNPERVRGLVLFYSIPGNQDPRYFTVPPGRPELESVPVRQTRAEFIEGAPLFWRWIANGTSIDDDDIRGLAARAFDRGYAPEGACRHWTALLRTPDRFARLTQITSPTLIVHGRRDPILAWAAAVDLAAAIPDSELRVFPDMGHTITTELWPEFVAGIVRTAERWEAHHA
jgi:pimeloyl-ACP methyl ester carboxylesterase